MIPMPRLNVSFMLGNFPWRYWNSGSHLRGFFFYVHRKKDLWFLSYWKEYDRSNSFPIDYWPSRILLGSWSKEKLPLQSCFFQFERNPKFMYRSLMHDIFTNEQTGMEEFFLQLFYSRWLKTNNWLGYRFDANEK